MKRLIVLLGVAGVSLSALFVRWSTAPSLIMALYRMAFAALLTAPAALRRRRELRGGSRRALGLSLASGCFLGLHFACYFEALHRTSIASAVVLVDTEVLFVALASVLVLKKRLGGRAWGAVLLSFAGAAVVALADRSAAGAVQGDLIALAGAVCVSIYTLLGSVCRENLSTAVYTHLVYLSATGTLLLAAALSGTALGGYGPVNLLTGLGLAVFCTLLGHSVFSWGLKYLPPAFISTVKLLEPVFSALYGFALFGEKPGLWAVLGGGMILLGVALYSLQPPGDAKGEELSWNNEERSASSP